MTVSLGQQQATADDRDLEISFNPRRYFGSNRPDFIIQPKKNDMTHYFFKLKLIGLGSFSVKNIYMNIFVMPLYCTPPLRVT